MMAADKVVSIFCDAGTIAPDKVLFQPKQVKKIYFSMKIYRVLLLQIVPSVDISCKLFHKT